MSALRKGATSSDPPPLPTPNQVDGTGRGAGNGDGDGNEDCIDLHCTLELRKGMATPQCMQGFF